MSTLKQPLSPEELEELNELVGALREETITDEQTARLDQILAETPAAMEAFAQMIHLIADLQWRQGAHGALSPSKIIKLPLKKSPRTWMLAIAASLVLVLGVFAGVWGVGANTSAKRLEAWKTSHHYLSDYPSALLYLDFEQKPAEGILTNRATHALPQVNAGVTGCDWQEGRWSKKRAIEFKTLNDTLTVSLPGSFKSLTLLAWIRVDRLPTSKQQGIVMTKSCELGSLQWYVQADGTLGLGVQRGTPQSWRCLHSPCVIPKELLGTWILAACVIDGDEGTVTHYCNGQPMGTSLDDSLPPMHLDTFGIGNWPVDPKDSRWTASRKRGEGSHSINLNGRMDELAILSSPLSAKEIRGIYENSRQGKTNLAKREPPPASEPVHGN